MKVAIRDVSTLRGLKPLEIAAYLRAKGWRQEGEFDGKASLWLLRPEVGEEVDVTLPLRQDLGDFALRMSEILGTLARVEDRSQLDIIQDLLTVTSDLIRVRASSRDHDDGTLPLEQAVEFVERSRDLMLAAACATLNKRPYFGPRKPFQATDYLRQLRMGQTGGGSYVLTILSPVTPELRAPQDEPHEPPPEPYERQVIRTLLDALTAALQAARLAAANGVMQPFRAAIGRGVSANLCEAIVGLSKSSPEGLEIAVSWARARPMQATVPARVFLASDSITIIAEAGRLFRETAPIEDFDLEGVVTRLHRPEGATVGDVAITGYVDGQLRNIVVPLGAPFYSRAVRAHDERRSVTCQGDLVKEGRGYRLQNPRHFELAAAEDALES